MFRRKPTDADPLLDAPLPARAEIAQTRLAHQGDPALIAALSERELRDERAVAEMMRDHTRHESIATVKSAQAIAAEVRRAQEEMVRAEAADLVVARRAIADRLRSASATFDIARLHRQKTLAARGLTGVVMASMLWSALNVQHNVAPGGPSDPLYWGSYLLEATISVVLVVFMVSGASVSRWRITEGDERIRRIEYALLAGSIGLNVFPYVRAMDAFGAVVHAVAPVMVGVALFAHPLVQRRYGLAIDAAKAAADAEGDDIAERLDALTATAARTTPTANRTTPPAGTLDEPLALEGADPALVARTSRPRADEVLTASVGTDFVRTSSARTSGEPAVEPTPHFASAGSAGPAQPESADTSVERQPAPARTEDPAAAAAAVPVSAPLSDDSTVEEQVRALHGSDSTPAAVSTVTEPRPQPEQVDAARDPENGETEDAAVEAGATVRAESAGGVEPAPSARTRTSAPTRTSLPSHTSAVSADTEPALTAPVASALALSRSTSADGDSEVRAAFAALAEQVRARKVGRRLTVDAVAQVLELLAAADATVNAVHEATRVHRTTIERIRDTAALVRAETAAPGEGGRVIELRKPDRA